MKAQQNMYTDKIKYFTNGMQNRKVLGSFANNSKEEQAQRHHSASQKRIVKRKQPIAETAYATTVKIPHKQRVGTSHGGANLVN